MPKSLLPKPLNPCQLTLLALVFSGAVLAGETPREPADTPPTPSQEAVLAAADKRAAPPQPGRIGEESERSHALYTPTDRECPVSAEHHLPRQVALVSFPRLEVASSTAGSLHDAERALPEQLAARLRERRIAAPATALPTGLAGAEHSSPARAAEQARRLAERQRAQYVLSGQIVDMSMGQPGETYYPGLTARARNLFHDTIVSTPLDRRTRQFVFRLTLRDGITGQALIDRHYHTSGIWNLRQRRPVGFASERFWQTDYGEKIAQLIDRAAGDISEEIHCLPYMARIDSRSPGDEVALDSGADSGLRSGDVLELYRVVNQPVRGQYRQYHKRLVPADARVRVREVYPGHALAGLESSTPMQGRYLAVIPARGGSH